MNLPRYDRLQGTAPLRRHRGSDAADGTIAYTGPVPPASDLGPPPSYSTAHVARRLGVSIPTIQRWVDLGVLRAWKTVGGHRRIDAKSAEKLFASQAAVGDRPTGAPLSALVIDDNEDDRDLLSTLIEAALPNAQVQTADSGFSGLVAIGIHAPDVLVTDIAMPHINGVEMLRALSRHRAFRPRVVVAVSSHTPLQIARLGKLPPDVRFIAKPVDPDAFIEVIRTAVTARSGSGETLAP
jgi:excisionase family DNA binding protein